MLAVAAMLGLLALSADPADAQLPVTCGGAIQKCPEGKTMYCNRWRACKKGKPKVGKYCDAPVCITEKKK
jgi:hypothetical protein